MTHSPLDRVEMYLNRFVAYPSDHARIAHVLWIAHTHLIQSFDTTPRLAFMSQERESGKTRALEVTAPFVPGPIMSFSASPAYIVRKVNAREATILFDEIDALFGVSVKAQDGSADLRSLLNGGYRRGSVVGRCTTNGKKVETEELSAFAPVALAGLRSLPDTLASRAIIIRMRRRAPDENVEPFRHKFHLREAKPIADELAEWCAEHEGKIEDPELPHGVVDRAADIWEPLIAIADMAGGTWPEQARAAALFFTKANAEDEAMTSGVELLAHIRDALGDKPNMFTSDLLKALCDRDESPWSDIRGRPLDARGLAKRLKGYGIKSGTVRHDDATAKGYCAAALPRSCPWAALQP
jgi:Protein of unknown function (DUF3631)